MILWNKHIDTLQEWTPAGNPQRAGTHLDMVVRGRLFRPAFDPLPFFLGPTAEDGCSLRVHKSRRWNTAYSQSINKYVQIVCAMYAAQLFILLHVSEETKMWVYYKYGPRWLTYRLLVMLLCNIQGHQYTYTINTSVNIASTSIVYRESLVSIGVPLVIGVLPVGEVTWWRPWLPHCRLLFVGCATTFRWTGCRIWGRLDNLHLVVVILNTFNSYIN